MMQAGQAGQYSNKILPDNIARVTVKQGSTVIGTVDGVADLDGQWQTAGDDADTRHLHRDDDGVDPRRHARRRLPRPPQAGQRRAGVTIVVSEG